MKGSGGHSPTEYFLLMMVESTPLPLPHTPSSLEESPSIVQTGTEGGELIGVKNNSEWKDSL